ncbi:hypothetical protein WJX72_000092 [[Myrmecia] bisecta]|uniref:O-methyltransferase n=1 Tax=[Myrmecia] bisecta TaxID=41462 RepID=A0AAW1P2D3_9CHLO
MWHGRQDRSCCAIVLLCVPDAFGLGAAGGSQADCLESEWASCVAALSCMATIFSLSLPGLVLCVLLGFTIWLYFHLGPAGTEEDRQLQLLNSSRPTSWLAYRLVSWIQWRVNQLFNRLMPAPLRIADCALRHAHSQMLYAVTKLGVVDVLKGKAMTYREIAVAVGAHPESLFRLLRAVHAALGLFDVTSDALGSEYRFRNNAMSSVLREDHPNCMRAWVLHAAEDTYGPWAHLLPAVKQGKAAFQLWPGSGGKDMYSYLRAHPEAGANLGEAMHAMDGFGLEAVVDDYRWGRFTRVIDVAGAHGSFLAAILRKHPHLLGQLFNQPQVIQRARQMWAESREWQVVTSRAEFATGDLFDAETIPAAASEHDAYVLRAVMADWADEPAQGILRNIRTAMGRFDASVVVVEALMPPGLEDSSMERTLLDMHVMVMDGGKVRNLEQWRRLFLASGFQLARVQHTHGRLSILTAKPQR